MIRTTVPFGDEKVRSGPQEDTKKKHNFSQRLDADDSNVLPVFCHTLGPVPNGQNIF